MLPAWSDSEAQRCRTPLALRAYTSRLIGSDPALVLHGGGNTSLKTDGRLYVKVTGADLAAVEEHHFTALDLDALRRLSCEERLSDAAMMRGIDACKLDPAAPKPSIETLLHAVLPHAWVEHTHADAVLAVVNVSRSREACAEAFGGLAPVVPYRHSGAALARACRKVFEQEAGPATIGLILAFHGVVAFGRTARESYDNLQRLVRQAEHYLSRFAPATAQPAAVEPDMSAAAALRDEASAVAGFPLAMSVVCTPQTLAFAQHPDLAVISQQGPPTPQHAIYTKRVPLIDGDVPRFAAGYRDYLERTLGPAGRSIDAAPRIILDPRFGLCALGVNDHYAGIAAEIYRHDIDIITRACGHGEYCAAGENDIARAELEYGGFERRVLAASGINRTGD